MALSLEDNVRSEAVTSALQVLERLACDSPATLKVLLEDDQLRKSFLSSMERLIPKLENPTEASQRLFYNVKSIQSY